MWQLDNCNLMIGAPVRRSSSPSFSNANHQGEGHIINGCTSSHYTSNSSHLQLYSATWHNSNQSLQNSHPCMSAGVSGSEPVSETEDETSSKVSKQSAQNHNKCRSSQNKHHQSVRTESIVCACVEGS
eukprot:Platyproteum_vivax@DN6673_c0_g1_i1.p1